MAQSKDGIGEKNLVPIKGKKTSRDNKPAKGFMCGTCLENPQFKEEGPRNAVMVDERTGDIRPVYYDNLLDSSTPSAGSKAEGSRRGRTTHQKHQKEVT